MWQGVELLVNYRHEAKEGFQQSWNQLEKRRVGDPIAPMGRLRTAWMSMCDQAATQRRELEQAQQLEESK